jgi:ppGpp synthetase/RelA/SpoT-type nucleotidyltranferase
MARTEIKPKYKKSRVDRAGDILISKTSSEDELDNAAVILDNWRSSHSFPLHTFKIRLKRVSARVDQRALVVQRLKRTPAIIKKLQRRYDGKNPTMKLTQMQDIGGCRAVLANVKMVRQLCDEYYHLDKNTRGKHCDLKHEFRNKKDYISNPKKDGYRSIHLIYRYNSDKTKTYNGLLLEIQIRSKLQHFWATAVETVDRFTKQAIKSNEGEKEWVDFFRLIGSVFADFEKTPKVPGTPEDKFELHRQVKELSTQLKVVDKIKSWAKLIRTIGELEQYHKSHFYLLDLDMGSKELHISTFDKADGEKANNAYSEAEKKASREGHSAR